MKVCHCTLAGTKACDTCQNGIAAASTEFDRTVIHHECAEEIERLRAWQQEVLPYLNVAAARFKPKPLDIIHFNKTIDDLDRLIAEAKEAKE